MCNDQRLARGIADQARAGLRRALEQKLIEAITAQAKTGLGQGTMLLGFCEIDRQPADGRGLTGLEAAPDAQLFQKRGYLWREKLAADLVPWEARLLDQVDGGAGL